MIPKIIHFTWFSNDPYPPEILQCMESWKNVLPEYTFIHWNMERIKDINVPFLKEAIQEKKWAYASDYVRLYAVYNYGGIYLDTDVLVYHNFNNLLNNPFFIGRENSWHLQGHSTVSYLSSHCFGAEKRHWFLRETFRYYENSNFVRCSCDDIPNEIRLNLILEPYVQAILAQKYGYDWNYSANHLQKLNDSVFIYPSEAFDATSAKYDGIKYCKHLAAGGWREKELYNPKISFKYKIKWRIIFVINYLLSKFGYTTIKLT